MGCHTWSYVKVKSLPQEQIDQLYETAKNSIIKEYNECQSITLEDEIDDIKKICSDMSYANIQKYCIKHRKNVDRYYKNINDIFKTIYAADSSDGVDVKYVGNELYIQIGFDIPFRVYGYPENTFTKKDELLKWLESQNSNMIGFYNEFSYNWTPGFTYELVEKINNWYDKYGEDNCYFEFG